jgi:voltage-gated potassium channel
MVDQARNLKQRLHEVIFEADTAAGKTFDVALLILIVLSVGAVLAESMTELRDRYGTWLRIVEWSFTILFTIEYVARLASVRRPTGYAFSFFGVIDLLSILPSYISLFVPGAQPLAVIRAFRLLRVFRVFKVVRYIHEVGALVAAVRATRAKIVVFLFTVLTMVIIMGSVMYVIEGAENGFTSIPRAMYWAIVTITTVGYGDIAPRTVWGQAVAAVAMVMGYSLIIIPTGIFSMELARASLGQVTTQNCPECVREGHDADAVHCKFCGTRL